MGACTYVVSAQVSFAESLLPTGLLRSSMMFHPREMILVGYSCFCLYWALLSPHINYDVDNSVLSLLKDDPLKFKCECIQTSEYRSKIVFRKDENRKEFHLLLRDPTDQ